jgi:hypothetical protein
MIQAVLRLVVALAGVSVVVGGVLALAMVIWAQDIPSALHILGNGYYALVGLIPIALCLTLYLARGDEDYNLAYGSPLRALLTVLQGAIVGSTLGAGPVFLTVVINIPVLLADFEMSEFGPAVWNAVVWSRLWLAVGAAVASAVPLGFWAYYAGSGWGDN